jgi:murein DD-endopeptidase MepM/ murein hydrolase activator NlpD
MLTSPFGWRIHPIFGTREFHTGIDIAGPSGAPVLAAYAGTVRFVGWQEGYGKRIVVDSGGGLVTAYSHLSVTDVQPQAYVTQGQEIGRIGSTGWSTGPHLLFEVYENGVPQNPTGYLP